MQRLHAICNRLYIHGRKGINFYEERQIKRAKTCFAFVWHDKDQKKRAQNFDLYQLFYLPLRLKRIKISKATTTYNESNL